jgi:hypothetical protein
MLLRVVPPYGGWDFTPVANDITDEQGILLMFIIMIVMFGGAALGGWLSARDKLKNGERHYEKRWRPGRIWGRRYKRRK